MPEFLLLLLLVLLISHTRSLSCERPIDTNHSQVEVGLALIIRNALLLLHPQELCQQCRRRIVYQHSSLLFSVCIRVPISTLSDIRRIDTKKQCFLASAREKIMRTFDYRRREEIPRDAEIYTTKRRMAT